MRPYRSLLFVPGHKPQWFDGAVQCGADAVILDLEDAVGGSAKAAARQAIADWVVDSVDRRGRVGVWIRLNGWDSGFAGDDLEATLRPGVDGFMLPKLTGPEDVVRFDALVTHFEARQNLEAGTIRFIPLLETPTAVATCEEIARATPRVATLVGSTGRGGDIARALGFQFTPAGLETLYLRSRIVVACRAAGLRHPLCGTWQGVSDLDGLAAFATQNRELGYRGQLVIHPSHVAVANRTFLPSNEEIQFSEGLIAAFAQAETTGDAAIRYGGELVDYAHVQSARDLLELAAHFKQPAVSKVEKRGRQ